MCMGMGLFTLEGEPTSSHTTAPLQWHAFLSSHWPSVPNSSSAGVGGWRSEKSIPTHAGILFNLSLCKWALLLQIHVIALYVQKTIFHVSLLLCWILHSFYLFSHNIPWDLCERKFIQMIHFRLDTNEMYSLVQDRTCVIWKNWNQGNPKG